MFGLPRDLVISYAIFGALLFEQKLYFKQRSAHGTWFDRGLALWTFAGVVFQIGFLGYLWYITSLWAAIKLAVLGVALWIPSIVVMRIIRASDVLALIVVVLSFGAVPVCAYLMVVTLP